MGIKTRCLHCCVSALLILIVGCSKRNFYDAPGDKTNFFSHTVKHYGENLTVIALWYSGSAKAADEISKYNPTLKSKTLKVGTRIQIPLPLIKRRTPLPKDFVSEALLSKPKKSQRKVPQAGEVTPTPNPESIERAPATSVITDSPEAAARRRQVLQELLEE